MTHLVLALALLAAPPATASAPQAAAAPARKPAAAAKAPAGDRLAEAYYQFLLGRHLEEAGDTDGAIAAYRRAIEIDTTSAEIHAELAGLFLRQQREDEAVASAEAALKNDATNVEANRLLGVIYADRAGAGAEESEEDAVDAEAARKAVDYLERALARAGTSEAVGIRMTLGRMYLLTKAPEKAVTVLRQMLVDEPGIPHGIALLVRALNAAGRAGEAVALLKDAAAADPAFYGSLGDAYEKESKWAEAAAAYAEASARSPRNTDLKTRWALALLNTDVEENVRRARDLLVEVTSANPTSGWPLYLLARAQRETGDLDAAEKTARRLLALSSTSVSGAHALAQTLAQRRDFAGVVEALEPIVPKLPQDRGNDRALLLSHLGFAYLETGRVDDAIAAFDQARTLNPADVSTVIYLAQALNTGKQFDKAVALVRPIRATHASDVRLARAEADALRGLGRVEDGAAVLAALADAPAAPAETFQALGEYYAAAHRYAQAAEVLTRARQRFPADDDVLFQLGAMLERQHLTADAERVFRDVIARDPKHSAALNYLGYMMADQGRQLAEALDLIKRAVALDPYNGAYLDSLGWAHFKLGQLDEAETHLKAAAALVPRDSAVLDHWGDLLARRGRHAAAADAWKRALAGDGESIDRAAIERKIKKALAATR